MNRSIRMGLAALATVSVVALAGVGTAAAADKYVPFVTDFPKGDTPAEAYRPFATDFGIAPRPGGGGFVVHARAQAEQPPAGRAWGDVALGGALGMAAAGLVAAAALGVRSARLRAGRRPGSLEPQGVQPR